MSKENEDSNYELILNAFISLLIRVGYQATTINKIAETANVNPSTVFRKFKDKEGLLNVVIDRHLQDLSTIFDDFTATGNIENDLVTMSKIYQEFQISHQQIVVVGFQESFKRPDIAKAVEDIPIKFRAILLAYFDDMKRQEKIASTIDTDSATMNFVLLNFGYFISTIRFNNPKLVVTSNDFYNKQIRFFAKSLQ
ncbi:MULTISPECIES: TetR/AcrR family transcriptional regulator [Leuconostoc]|uniref:Regulatory protein, TetR n=2 Tax=Leuconostoc TaxID=1243 RepID=A0AAN2QWG5_9LACO|nr:MULTISPECIES: TetR/AcrR family transcriptional regulator [Leuconostoc]MBR2276758.1 TetR/AcrR family transcriptional regulator [Leuconostoc sp.]MBZ5943570.1 TetR/AcrR family transcriptional regulator [Leuconostoc gasicomitatum]MBZ5947408.1 TetR/AcrR family transcriptional regulator [Leuconostoc gasicomitatum]MBZ5948865.1 TetR/AcrR family transcriptional regulator [Leuconostoc gasicomitatum]MBZ5951804.1 TetR/AcrR family transcriptional regulator [Leuconostoc gasicomitatum]